VLVDEGVFSKSLFGSLDEAKAQQEYQTHKETFFAEVATARSRVQTLYSSEAIRSGDQTRKAFIFDGDHITLAYQQDYVRA
jgi:hypothetical protein